MIARELLEELQSIRRDFDWCYCGTTRKIRGKPAAAAEGGMFDPIGAVCYAKTGVVFGENEWLRAADLLELSHIDAADLTAAANNVPSGPGQYYTQTLRRQMINGVLLQPESAAVSENASLITGYLPTLLRKKAHGGAKS